MEIAATPTGNKAWYGFLLGLGAYATYNGCDVFIKMLSKHYPITEVVFWIIFLPLPLIYSFVRWHGGRNCMRTCTPGLQVFRGILFFISTVTAWYGVQHLPLANFYTFSFAEPLFTVLFALLWLRERLTRLQIALLLISFTGIVIAFHPDPRQINFAALAVLGGTIAGAFGLVIIRRKSGNEGLGATIVIPEAVAAALAAAFGFHAFIWPDAQGWLYFWIAAMLFGIANCLLILAFYKAPASQVTPTQYSQMIWGTLLGYFVFGNVPDGWIIAGAAIIVAAGVGLVRIEYKKTHGARAHG